MYKRQAEHYTNAIYDEWTEAARYLDGFVRDPNPPRVVYTVKPAMEYATERVSPAENGDPPLSYSFDGAYWIDDLSVRSGAPTDPDTLGTIDALSYGRGVVETIGIPEASSGGQFAPHVMVGQRLVRSGYIEPANALEVTLTNIATGSIDLARAGIGTGKPITVAVTTDGPATLDLRGRFASPAVTGADAATVSSAGVEVSFAAAGIYEVTIG